MRLFTLLIKPNCIFNKNYENAQQNAKREKEKCRFRSIQRDLKKRHMQLVCYEVTAKIKFTHSQVFRLHLSNALWLR